MSNQWDDIELPTNIRNAKCCKFCKHYGTNAGADILAACQKYPDTPFMVYVTSLCDNFEDVEVT